MSFPDAADAAYFDVVERAVVGHPRSAQVAVGPSGIGDPCDRSLLHALAGDRAPRQAFSGWKPTVGTAAHAWLAEAFEAENRRLGWRRWLTEQRLSCGSYAGVPVRGTADLYDLASFEVLDHKLVGPSMLRKYRSSGPGQRYRVQAQLYGLGAASEGWQPRSVAVAFLPRDGELWSAWVHREPYDESVALEALDHAGRLKRLLDEHGGDATAASDGMERCDQGAWCDWCRAPRLGGSIFAT